MKKIVILLMFLPNLLFADVIKDYQKQYSYINNFNVEGQVIFKVNSMHEYNFSVVLRKNTQYCFILEGVNDFHFQIIEESGNGWEGCFSRNNRLIKLENIMDKGRYTIRIYSFKNNYIKMYWGEY